MKRIRRHGGVGVLDILDDAVMSLTERPLRAAMTALGTLVGTAMLVAVVGVTAMAKIQVDSRFDALGATEVTLTQTDAASARDGTVITEGSERSVEEIEGVVRAGLTWHVADKADDVALTPNAGARDPDVPVVLAATRGALAEAGVTYSAGSGYTAYEAAHAQRVVVLGRLVARDLGVASLRADPVVYISGLPFRVAGIASASRRHPEILGDVMMPTTTAARYFPSRAQDAAATMWVEVRPGAAGVVAHQLPIAVDVLHPERYLAVAPPDPSQLRRSISADMQQLSYLLAGICLVLGLIGIANTTLIAVMERVGEIGLRRALGARRREIAAQFLTESVVIGAAGGVAGALVGLVTIVGVALARQWTALIAPELLLAGPVVGAVVGVLAGAYPALRAASIEPVAALREG